MRIPVQALKDIAAKYDLTHIVMLAYHPDDQTNHVVTYGKSVEDCSQAADFGNKLKDALGWPESLHAQPSRVKKLESQIASLEAQLEAVRRLSDVGDLFDGADHLNEYTHKENEKHLTSALDKIHAIVTGKIALEDI